MKSFQTFLTEDKTDTICLNVPLFIRLLEHAREDVKTDETLHIMTENILNLHRNGVSILGMDNYKKIVGTNK